MQSASDLELSTLIQRIETKYLSDTNTIVGINTIDILIDPLTCSRQCDGRRSNFICAGVGRSFDGGGNPEPPTGTNEPLSHPAAATNPHNGLCIFFFLCFYDDPFSSVCADINRILQMSKVKWQLGAFFLFTQPITGFLTHIQPGKVGQSSAREDGK